MSERIHTGRTLVGLGRTQVCQRQYDGLQRVVPVRIPLVERDDDLLILAVVGLAVGQDAQFAAGATEHQSVVAADVGIEVIAHAAEAGDDAAVAHTLVEVQFSAGILVGHQCIGLCTVPLVEHRRCQRSPVVGSLEVVNLCKGEDIVEHHTRAVGEILREQPVTLCHIVTVDGI